jgi:hypothetical protein
LQRRDKGEEVYKDLWEFKLTLTQITQVDGIYNPIVDSCIIPHTRQGLVTALGVLVVDVVLLLTMLIGLLRHVHRSSIGVWRFLYQQVTPKTFSVLRRMLSSF